MPTAQVQLDTTQYVKVNIGFNKIVLQCLRDAVRVVISQSKPAKSNTSYHLLGGDKQPLTFDTLDTHVWALATTATSSLISTETDRFLPVSSMNAMSAAGAYGKAFARTIPITVPAESSHSVRFQKNSNIAVRFIRAKGLFIDAVRGTVAGDIIALESLISTNGIIVPDFFGSIEVFNQQATGDVAIGAFDELSDSFYPDGQFCIDLRNPSSEDVSTFLSVGVEQISDAGTFTILEPNTQLEANTEMSDYNGSN